ncbi:hypothetical protein GPECTOR_10g1089 [Gonium pectorale]|uniref:Glycosyl transferase CAP10 domain-containing protein n=1 Tax=Gonium pectorale TaxID=33097 RepID=A0A150GQC2_GONPE|nr:hypothetical protein GPECTOR_10g1089 [Gonium pectorale]|eukprot:KXZ52066.1 hypothetical protein GPECTOR_10g1089 [Gonium pectorale]
MPQAFLSRLLAYTDVLLDLESKYGSLIPDCEFKPVLDHLRTNDSSSSTANRTAAAVAVATVAAARGPGARRALQQYLNTAGAAAAMRDMYYPHGLPGTPNGTFPILRSVKSLAFPGDILIPSHDFYLLRYDSTVLNASARLLEERPYVARMPTAYAKYDMHAARQRHAEDPTTLRFGLDHEPVCTSSQGTICFVRRHLLGVASYNPLLQLRHHAPEAGREHYHLVDLHTPRQAALAAARAAALEAAIARARADSSGAAFDPNVLEALLEVDDDGGHPVDSEHNAFVAGLGGTYTGQSSAYHTTTASINASGGGGASVDTGGAEGAGDSGNGTEAAAAPNVLPEYLVEASKHRVLVHLDGHGLSSSLERLLALGSTVLKEESGYYGYYHLAMEPYVHYIPWWEHVPNELWEHLDWVAKHESKAREIGAAGRDFARRYLTAQGRACYWLTLLRRLAAALRYPPRLAAHPRAMPLAKFREQHILRMRPAKGQRPLFGQPFEP